MENVIMQDVCEVFIKDVVNDKYFYYGLTSATEVNQTVDQEPLRAGIGNGIFAMLQKNKEINFTVTTKTHNDSIYAIQSGGEFVSKQFTVMKQEAKELVGGEINLDGTPKADKVVVVDQKGKTYTATCLTKVVTVTDGTDGNMYTVIYSEDVTGEVLDLNSKSFPKNYEVELHTIGYDPETNIVTCDVYWYFNKALPNGEINGSYSSGNNEDTIKFTAQLLVGSSSYGSYVVVPRA